MFVSLVSICEWQRVCVCVWVVHIPVPCVWAQQGFCCLQQHWAGPHDDDDDDYDEEEDDKDDEEDDDEDGGKDDQGGNNDAADSGGEADDSVVLIPCCNQENQNPQVNWSLDVTFS